MQSKSTLERIELLNSPGFSSHLLKVASGLMGRSKNVMANSLAGEVLKLVLDPSWLDERIRLKPDIFFRSGCSLEEIKFRHRFASLGNMIWTLRGADGMAGLIDELKTKDLQPYYYQMKAMYLMHINGFKVTCRPPTGNKKHDFDFHALRGELVFNCEVKAKEGRQTASPKSIENSIRKARKQLPKDLPSIVFVSTDDYLPAPNDEQEAIRQALEPVLRNATRINYVYMLSDVYGSFGQQVAAGSFHWGIKNSHAEVDYGDVELIRPLDTSKAFTTFPYFSEILDNPLLGGIPTIKY